MKRSLRERLQMYQLVHDLVENNQSVWEGIPKYTSTVDQFSVKFKELKELLNEHQLQYSVGIKQLRDQHRIELTEIAYRISRGMLTYAVFENDPVTNSVASLSRTSLNKLSQVGLILAIDRLLHHAENLAGELEPYGIGPEAIANFKTKRDNLSVNYLSPRKGILKRKEMGESIKKLEKEIDGLLRDALDNLTWIMNESHPEYVKAYKNSRQVISVVYSQNTNIQSPPQPDDGV